MGQLILMLWQFISAATGIAICAVVFMAMKGQGQERIFDSLPELAQNFIAGFGSPSLLGL